MTTISADGRGSELDGDQYQALLAGVTDWVTGPGEAWAERIESSHAPVPEELWTELRSLGYLSLAAPVELGGRGLSF
ncbi:MAG: acyl-CoA dehydrogenase family protein, partial [Rhodanobacteraceae bacterium]